MNCGRADLQRRIEIPALAPRPPVDQTRPALNIERQILLPNLAFNQTQLNGPLEDETIEIKLKVTNHGYFARNFIKIIEDCPFEQPEKRQQAFLVANIKAKSFTSFINSND